MSKWIRFYFSLIFLFSGFLLLHINTSDSQENKSVYLIQLNDDSINPVTAEYIIESIDLAETNDAEALIIKLDTPGGLLASTRQIVKSILESEVPIIVYIAPSGSRAGSAGVFITYASHVAAMAPSTNIGAAHPVQIGGGKGPKQKSDWRDLKELIEELKNIRDNQLGDKADKDQTDDKAVSDEESEEADQAPMESKILNDTLAFIRSIAKQRNRNVEWAELSVSQSKSITNDEALEKGVVEIIAKDEAELLNKIHGRTVMIKDKEVVLNTKDAVIQTVSMDTKQKFFNVLANPNIAYFLLILGFYGLLFEITHPGIGVPGILGAIFLILALYSMQTLPTNYAGLSLLVLGLVLLIAEVYTPTFGLLTLGGVVCMILGSMLLFDSVDPVMRVSLSVIFTFAITTGLIMGTVVLAMIRIRKSKVKTGQKGLVGEKGEAQTKIEPQKKGKVFVHGEIWNAKSEESIKKGDPIVIEKIEGLTVTVKNASKEAE